MSIMALRLDAVPDDVSAGMVPTWVAALARARKATNRNDNPLRDTGDGDTGGRALKGRSRGTINGDAAFCTVSDVQAQRTGEMRGEATRATQGM